MDIRTALSALEARITSWVPLTDPSRRYRIDHTHQMTGPVDRLVSLIPTRMSRTAYGQWTAEVSMHVRWTRGHDAQKSMRDAAADAADVLGRIQYQATHPSYISGATVDVPGFKIAPQADQGIIIATYPITLTW